MLPRKRMDFLVDIQIQRRRVRTALGQLPADQQKALALAYFGGYTHREIAEALEEPLGTV
ncbi:MAG TPA: RNA polymerase subunit sigma, partial [Candidatus Aminicenantes bacterium]|nr:RNA polymerase subunit sigma [Candidatus Aminicenantes bacterium]